MTNDDRRDVPEGSGAFCCVGFSWERIVELLLPTIVKAAPEVRKKELIWMIRARNNGVRIEFYGDEVAFRTMLLRDNPISQVHAGRVNILG